MSVLKARCDRVKDEVPLETLFTHLGWEYREKGRIHCIWPDHEDRSPAMQVYPETQSVHCFACGQAGDVIKIVRRCVAPQDGAWDVEQALDWLEQAFGLSKMAEPVKVASRLSRKLEQWRSRGAASQASTPLDVTEARRQVDLAFHEVESHVPQWILRAAGPHKDYVLDQFAPHGDIVAWAAWARSHAYGSYATFIRMMSEPYEIPKDIYDDRPETIRQAMLWETHRGIEFASPWPVYV